MTTLAGRMAPELMPDERLGSGAKAYVTGVFYSSVIGKRSSPSMCVGIDRDKSWFFLALEAARL